MTKKGTQFLELSYENLGPIPITLDCWASLVHVTLQSDEREIVDDGIRQAIGNT